MKTNTHHTSKREASAFRPDHLNLTADSEPRKRPALDFAKRQANRQLDTQDLLALLRSTAPDFLSLAQIVGKWVWIQFADKQPPEVTSRLAEFGFHWNNKRQLWQHPCGGTTADTSPDDPRAKYGCQSAA